MGKRNKRARLFLRKASILGEEIPPEVAKRYGITDLLPQKSNSEKIEELKQEPVTVVEEPVTVQEPKFVTEAPKIVVKEDVVATKPTPKKKTTRKRAPRKTKVTRAKKTTAKKNTKDK